jgi:hypothetical protein
MHPAVLKSVRMWKNSICLCSVRHIFLNSKIVHADIEMKSRGHADRTEVRGAVRASSNVIHLGEICDPSQLRDAPAMNHGRPDVIDQLFLDQLLAIINAVKHFADRQRCGGVLSDNPKALLQFGGNGILQPK